MSLQSTYVSLGAEPAFTNYTSTFQGCLDYIFTNEGLETVSVTPLPEEALVQLHTAYPSIEWPSDHLRLGVTLKFAEVL